MRSLSWYRRSPLGKLMMPLLSSCEAGTGARSSPGVLGQSKPNRKHPVDGNLQHLHEILLPCTQLFCARDRMCSG